MITAFLVATVTVDGETKKFDIGLPYTDIDALTDEELMQTGTQIGEAYGKLLIKVKNREFA